MKYKVLYAEDELTLAQIISDGLGQSGYEVVLATDGRQALEMFQKTPPDICVLDVMMPLKDGYTLAEDIRKLDTGVPIIFLSAKSLPEDVIKGFKSGGNDYLRKPFNMGELLIRMESLLSRFGAKQQDTGSVYTFGGCKLDPVSQELVTSVTRYTLSYKEAALLELLLQNKNTLVPRQVPLLKIWGDDTYYNARSMDVFMSHLRKMLKNEPGVQLMSIRGAGYKLIV
ncbi:response regulator transcription factor [Chitinophaga sancti]|uniref:DNA-binding response regulator, OmpR family, contains REC and winged-helix (WHTH) domain n=1 Tax=Chitinophaga sancti TaxID=1004 RepID=A0A1K1S0L1_9BACT|nr:response regulator transcription factor [Chitinophaga sancti]WQD59750.1 response regulator transcription factor [Chitinophaga sancti]WQG88119.1 response regulator transcription factor [Chitinophaga sancti]SFW77968.1 DNA-binding response regulator, OmpR family, contains REC and winged-helix (wHTH) domain [Chitinophaga sancti]